MSTIGESICGTNAKIKLRELASSVNQIKGDVVEVGVYKGGTAKILADILVDSSIFLFDTFEGLPDTNTFDNVHAKGDFNDITYQEIVDYFNIYNNVTVHKGVFPRQNSEILENRMFKFVHLDVDIYDSYKECLNFFNNKIVSGGIMLFDDYGAHTCLGSKKAIDEFIEENGYTLMIGGDFQRYIIY